MVMPAIARASPLGGELNTPNRAFFEETAAPSETSRHDLGSTIALSPDAPHEASSVRSAEDLVTDPSLAGSLGQVKPVPPSGETLNLASPGTYKNVPEPSSFALLATGLLGSFGLLESLRQRSASVG